MTVKEINDLKGWARTYANKCAVEAEERAEAELQRLFALAWQPEIKTKPIARNKVSSKPQKNIKSK